MSNILTFAPRPQVAAQPVVQVMSLAERLAHLEDALQTSLDTADHIMAALHQWDDEQEEEGDGTKPAVADPAFKAMATYSGQTVTLHEPIILPEAPALAETVEPEIAPEPQEAIEAQTIIVSEPLRWSGAGNVISAAGIALFSLVAGT